MTHKTDDTIAGGFSGLGLIEELATAVSALGYEEPTPVQRETIPLLIAGRDLLAQAATGIRQAHQHLALVSGIALPAQIAHRLELLQDRGQRVGFEEQFLTKARDGLAVLFP